MTEIVCCPPNRVVVLNNLGVIECYHVASNGLLYLLLGRPALCCQITVESMYPLVGCQRVGPSGSLYLLNVKFCSHKN